MTDRSGQNDGEKAAKRVAGSTSKRQREQEQQPAQQHQLSSSIRKSRLQQRPLLYRTAPVSEQQFAASIQNLSASQLVAKRALIAQQARPLLGRSSAVQAIQQAQQEATFVTATSHRQVIDKNGQIAIAIPPRRPTHHPAAYSSEQHSHQLGSLQQVGPGASSPGAPNRYLTGNQAPIVGAMSAKLDSGNSAAQAAIDSNNRYAWARLAKARAAQAAALAANQDQADEEGSAAAAGNSANKFQYHFSSPFSASRVLIVNPMQIVNLSEHTKSKLIKIIEALKRFSEKWFSHVLLLMFLAVYACLGAYVFISFEANTEQWEKQNIIEQRAQIVNETWLEAQAKSREQFATYLVGKLEDYERLLARACQSGMTSSSLENQWTFWGALFYSMTVFTTIGYGHLTPITFAGRVATMVYAIFGIPILLMVLADLGKLLTRIIKFAFKQFRTLYNKCMNRKSSLRTRKMISDNTSQYIGVARDAFEGWSERVMTRAGSLKHLSMSSSRHHLYERRQKRRLQSSPLLHQDQLEPLQQAPNLNIDPLKTQLSLELEASKLEHQDHLMVASDVIVTPALQTEPVSPILLKNRNRHSSNLNNKAHSQNNKKSPNNNANSKETSRKTSTTSSTGSSNTPKKSLAAPARSLSNTSQSQDPKSELAGAIEVASVEKDALNCKDSEEKITLQEEAQLADQNSHQEEQLSLKNPEQLLGDYQSQHELQELDPFHVEGEDGSEEEEEEEDLDIPVSFALFLLVTYMMFGAVVFSIWEGWNFFDSLYFVFISMSTIGFGDLVPQHPKRMIGTFIYLLFGLALTSMCINVVQERIHSTFLRAKMQIGEKMGLDLDQIMADDYYHDQGMSDSELAECYDDPDQYQQQTLEAGESCSTSSALASPTGPMSKSGLEPSGSNNELAVATSATPSSPGKALLRSQNSIKSSGSGGGGGGGGSANKKKSATSSASHGPDKSSQSLWRKSSKKTHSQTRNASPRPAAIATSNQDAATTTHPNKDSSQKTQEPTINVNPIAANNNPPPPTNVIPATPTPTPSPNATADASAATESPANPLGQFLTLNDSNRPKEDEKAEETNDIGDETETDLQATRSNDEATKQQPRIRPRLTSSQSQPSDLRQRHFPMPTTSNFESLIRAQSSANSSASSTRRGSVSLELSQLDELLQVLKSPSAAGRYGPLLGIPSRSSSTAGTPPRTPTPSNQLNRRAYSTISRSGRNPTNQLVSGRHSASPRPSVATKLAHDNSDPAQSGRLARASICYPPSSSQSFLASISRISAPPNRGSARRRSSEKKAPSKAQANQTRDPNAVLDEAIKAIQSAVM